jgi:hypothetical protein
MNRHVMSLIIGAAIFLTALSSAASAGTVEAQVLQYKLDHFYFNVGKESLVFPGHHFAIVRGKDTVVSGVIDESYDGVSIGTGALPKDGKRNFEKYKAVVDVAETERISLFRIGALKDHVPFIDTLSSIGLTGGIERYLVGKDTIDIREVSDTLQLFDQFENGSFDAIVYAGKSGAWTGRQVHFSGAPYYAVMAPNIKVPLNKGGLLTTSLYYRLDPQRINSSITLSCQPVNSFLEGDIGALRPYPIDAEKGRQLFRSIPNRPTIVRIFLADEELRPIALYLGDILAREQCRTEIVVGEEPDYDVAIFEDSGPWNDWSGCNSDIILQALCGDFNHSLHCSSASSVDSATGMMTVTTSSYGDTLPDHIKPLKEMCYLADSLLQYSWSAQTRADSITAIEQRTDLLTRANKLLMSDLGCFPLFRPMYTVVTRNDVRGIGLNSDGSIQASGIKRILLPDSSQGRQQ